MVRWVGLVLQAATVILLTLYERLARDICQAVAQPTRDPYGLICNEPRNVNPSKPYHRGRGCRN